MTRAQSKIDLLKAAWQNKTLAPQVQRFAERCARFTTSSDQIEVQPLYTPDQIGPVDDAAAAELNQRVERLRSQWQGKYNAPFDVEDENAVFENARITTTSGEGNRK